MTDTEFLASVDSAIARIVSRVQRNERKVLAYLDPVHILTQQQQRAAAGETHEPFALLICADGLL